VHLPEGRHREHEWMNLFEAACGRPVRQPHILAARPRTSRRNASGGESTPTPAPQSGSPARARKSNRMS
jgi:hypothetical protein